MLFKKTLLTSTMVTVSSCVPELSELTSSTLGLSGHATAISNNTFVKKWITVIICCYLSQTLQIRRRLPKFLVIQRTTPPLPVKTTTKSGPVGCGYDLDHKGW